MPAPDAIDGGFVPRRHAAALEIAVGNEVVVMRGLAHALNPTATLVWQCFDGEGTIDEIVSDLAEATGADRDVIENDVLALTRQLAEVGLLDGVAGVPDTMTAVTGPERLPVGAELGSLTLASLDGEDVTLGSYRGRPVLLVNWSPGCGFCLKIAGELGALQEELERQGISMVFVTSGDPDANRKVFADAGLTAPALVRTGVDDPFKGFGTPAAYLIDEDGKVAAPLSLGANQVPGFARDLARIDGDLEPRSAPAAMYLPAAAAVCGGGATAAANSTTTWAGTRVYQLGAFHVGIRYNSASTADLLDGLFADRRVEDPRAPENFSVALYPAQGRTRELNLLVKGGQQLVRSRSRLRVLQALLAHLSDEIAPRDPSLLRLRATAIVGDGKAFLGPPAMVTWVKQLQPRLARARLQMVDVAAVTVDASSGELVIPEPTVDQDPSVLDGLEDDVTLGSELPPVGAGRYPIRAWFLTVPADRAGTMAPALGVAGAAPLVVATGDALPGALSDLVTLIEQVEVVGVSFDSPASLVRQIAAFAT
jgi:thiol-disulfide isomerase/thioredoxin